MMSLATRIYLHAKDISRLGLAYQLRHLHRFSRREFRARVKNVGELTMRPRSGDAAVVSQVFSWRQYDTRGFPQHQRLVSVYQEILNRGRTPLILDLGANNGASAQWFAHEYPEAKIVAVEPDPDNARICRLNTPDERVEVITAAIGGAPGRISLNAPVNATLSYTASRSSDGEIPIVTVNQILSEHPEHELFIVKIDIEGFEEDLFATNTEWIRETCAIMIEPHDFKFPDRFTSQNLQKAMSRYPFQILLSGENLIYVRQ